MIEISVDTRRAVVTNKEILTSGSAGIQVQFTLSEDWTGLSKLAVFRTGEDGESIEVVLDNNLNCVVPAEALVTADEVLFIGVYGSDGNGTVIIPTIWAAAGVIRPGTEPNTPAEAEPTPEIWAQILSVAQEAETTATGAMNYVEQAVSDLGTLEDRVSDNEEDRVAAEQARASAEDTRAEAETARITNEDSRISAESNRNTAEVARSMAETARADAEAARVTAEQGRVTAENERAAAEAIREEKYAEYVETVSGYADDAEASAEAARTSMINAQSASGSASQSATSANNSATTATSKANEASSWASTALNAAGNAADSQNAAAQSATAAAASQTAAETAQAAAEAAQSAAEDAQDAAETAQAAAEAAASSISGKSEQIDQNTSDVGDLSRQISDLQENTTVGLFGAKWDRLTNRLTRLLGAKDITTDTTNFCHKGTINANYDNPFDEIYPWSEMYQCDVDLTKYRSGNYTLKECITAVYGDPDFTYIGSSTNFVGRYRPEFWYKSEEDENGNVYYYVSQIERAGYKHAEEAIDGISFAIDNGENGVTAGAGIPLTNIAVSQIHARAKTSGFTLQDINDIDALDILYLVEYANWNSQQALGDGCASCYRENDEDAISNVVVGNGETTFDITDSAMSSYMQVGAQFDIGATRGAVTYRGLLKSYTVNGSTCTVTLDRELAVTNGMIASIHGLSTCEFDLTGESIGNASGYLGTNGKANAWYRGGILYANRYQYVLGIYRQQNTNHLWICPDGVDPDEYDALNTAAHEDTGVALPDLAAAAWQTVGGNAQRIPGLAAFMATGESSGNSSSPVGDQQYVPLITAGDTILLFGCGAHNGWACGVLGGNWNHGAGNSYWNNAGRPILKKSL